MFERSFFFQTKNTILMNVNNFPLTWLYLDCVFHQWFKIVKCINKFLIYMHRSNKSDEVLDQAWQKITGIQQQKFLPMSKELHGEDPYQFLRAYTAGINRYMYNVTFKLIPIWAASFSNSKNYHFLVTKKMYIVQCIVINEFCRPWFAVVEFYWMWFEVFHVNTKCRYM